MIWYILLAITSNSGLKLYDSDNPISWFSSQASPQALAIAPLVRTLRLFYSCAASLLSSELWSNHWLLSTFLATPRPPAKLLWCLSALLCRKSCLPFINLMQMKMNLKRLWNFPCIGNIAADIILLNTPATSLTLSFLRR